MCTSPITIYNNSRYVNLTSFDVKRTVPCGHCWQCQMAKQSEYAIRSYYEWQHSKSVGSFAYWDTLTYNDGHLPNVFGVPCFRRKDIQDFMKRLRYDLDDKFKLSKDAFRYLAIGEYGGKNGRPHYHVIFFCKFPEEVCSVTQFHNLVVQNWRPWNGNTDFYHGRDPESLKIKSNAGLQYVTKYLYKDAGLFSELRQKVDAKIAQRFPDIVISNATYRKRFQNFQLHSLGFGSYLLDCQDVSNMTCTMPTKDNPEKEFRLPLYYLRMRKDKKNVLPYMDLIEIEDDSYKWVCTPLYVKYKLSNIEKSIQDGAIALRNRILNLSSNVEKIKINDNNAYEKIHLMADAINIPISRISDFLLSLYDFDSLRSLYTYAVAQQFRIGDDVEKLEDVIYNRATDLGCTVNPLRYDLDDYACYNRNLYDYECYIRGSTLYDITLDLLNYVASIYGKLQLSSELNKLHSKQQINE